MRRNCVFLKAKALDGHVVHVAALSGTEIISQPFEFHVDLACLDPVGISKPDVLMKPATLVFEYDGVETRRIHGLISSIKDLLSTEAQVRRYRLTLVPRLWQMSLSERVDVYLEMSVPAILQKKLTALGLKEDEDFVFRLRDEYPVREFVVQYRETDLQFVSRLCEHIGIFYFFEQRDDREVVVFGDDNSSFSTLEGGSDVPYRPHQLGAEGVEPRIQSLEITQKVLPKRYVLRDYNYRHPGVDLTAEAVISETGYGEIVEYGAHFKTPDEGKWLARIRAEEVRAQEQVYTATSDAARLRAGAVFVLTEHPEGDPKLVVTEVRHEARQPLPVVGSLDAGPTEYSNQVKAIPASTAYRPPRLTPKPFVAGTLTGVVDGAKDSKYAQVDDQGRYKVRFMFDTAERGEGQASRPVRMAQPHAGTGYGMHFPLRPGVEVLLVCVNGDPDRPVIVGTVPNPHTPGPVTAANATRNVIRTGGGNEINIDDTEGSTRITMRVPYSRSFIQIGAPNGPNPGILNSTESDFTSTVGGAFSTIAGLSTVLAKKDVKISSKIDSYAIPDPVERFKKVSEALEKFEAFVGMEPEVFLSSKYREKAKAYREMIAKMAKGAKGLADVFYSRRAKYIIDELAKQFDKRIQASMSIAAGSLEWGARIAPAEQPLTRKYSITNAACGHWIGFVLGSVFLHGKNGVTVSSRKRVGLSSQGEIVVHGLRGAEVFGKEKVYVTSGGVLDVEARNAVFDVGKKRGEGDAEIRCGRNFTVSVDKSFKEEAKERAIVVKERLDIASQGSATWKFGRDGVNIKADKGEWRVEIKEDDFLVGSKEQCLKLDKREFQVGSEKARIVAKQRLQLLCANQGGVAIQGKSVDINRILKILK